VKKEEKELMVKILTNYLTTKEKTVLTREEYQMTKEIIKKLK
jgi:hypothetical protein